MCLFLLFFPFLVFAQEIICFSHLLFNMLYVEFRLRLKLKWSSWFVCIIRSITIQLEHFKEKQKSASIFTLHLYLEIKLAVIIIHTSITINNIIRKIHFIFCRCPISVVNLVNWSNKFLVECYIYHWDIWRWTTW